MEYVSLFDRGYPLKALACRGIIFGEDDDAYEGNIQKTAGGRELEDNMVDNFEIETFGDFVLSIPWQVATRIVVVEGTRIGWLSLCEGEY